MKKILFILFLMASLISAGAAVAQNETPAGEQEQEDGGWFGLGEDDEQEQQEQAGETEAGTQDQMGQQQEMSFEEIDQDGDDNITQYELEQAGVQVEQQKFQEYDSDNDGVLGQDEFEEAKSEL
ncbi:MAG: hypothetical protein ACOC0K_01285, partial [bacterium]